MATAPFKSRGREFRGSSIRALLIILVAAFLVTSTTSAIAEDLSIRAMSFNLKYASDSKPNSWGERRPGVRNVIETYKPDMFGTQEGLYRQLRDIDDDLPDYDWIGQGRMGGSAGEFMAIYYRRDRLDPIAFGDFWLSETPEVIASKSWDSSLPRMATWVLFEHKATGARFYHFNTHFDHRGQTAREHASAIMLEQVRAADPKHPVIVTGDFNQSPENIVHEILVTAAEGQVNLRDSWPMAVERINEGISTMNGWRGPREGGHRIDWILITGEIRCTRAEIITYSDDGQFPSDHFPIVADLVLQSGSEPN